MHFKVLNKYIDMKLPKTTCLLCFYAFIAQKSFVTMNCCGLNVLGILCVHN